MKTLATPMPAIAAFVGIGVLCLMDAVIKEAAAQYPVGQVVALRFVAGTIVTFAWVIVARAPLPTRGGFRRALVRGTAILATSLLFYKTLVLLPLAEAVAITFVSPFMMLIVSRLLIGEPVTRRAVVAIAVGFCGVLVMLSGRLADGGGGDPMGYLTGLGASVTYAVAMVLTRRDSTRDAVAPLVLAQNVSVAVLAAPFGAVG
ncbi:MAG TPA: DMT family transporter, partial [Methylomirabilota bacterium]|nr:DMT family transporter [Methylomirabilota bacterium]